MISHALSVLLMLSIVASLVVTTYDLSACACCGSDEPGPGYEDDCGCPFEASYGAYFDIYRDLFGFVERVILQLDYDYVDGADYPHTWVGCAECEGGAEICVRIRCNPDSVGAPSAVNLQYRVDVDGVEFIAWRDGNSSPDGCDPLINQMSRDFLTLQTLCGFTDVETIYITVFSL